MKINLKTVTEEQLYEFCKDHYYCDTDDDGERCKWEPFENYDDDYIEEQISNDVYALKNFFNIK
jgi:hypothetical protein